MQVSFISAILNGKTNQRGSIIMKCKELMAKETRWCNPDCNVKHAVQLMKEQNCGAIPIVDEEMRLKGIVTDRDITLFVILQGKDPGETKLKDFMSKDVITCYDDDNLDTVISKMKQYQIRRIPIINRENKLQGMISLGDIAVKAPEEEQKTFEAFEKISESVKM